MVYFTCQLDWALERPESWWNVIYGHVCDGVSGRDKHLNWRIEESSWPFPTRVGIIQFIEGLDRIKRWKKVKFTLHLIVELEHWLPSALRGSGSQTFRLRLGSTPLTPWLSGLCTVHRLSWVSSLRIVDHRTPQPSCHVPILYNKFCFLYSNFYCMYNTFCYIYIYIIYRLGSGLPRWHSGKESAWHTGNAKPTVSIPGSGTAPGVGNSNPLQHSCLEDLMERGAWQAAVSPWFKLHLVFYLLWRTLMTTFYLLYMFLK